jgi:hypothetical protein
VTFSFDEAHRAILRPQLDAVRSVYDAVCAPYQAPAGWSGAIFASTVSTDTAGPPSCLHVVSTDTPVVAATPSNAI